MAAKYDATKEFLAALSTTCVFLEDAGFTLRRQLIEEASLFATVPFVGENIALRFGYDVRDCYVDLYIERVVEGRTQPIGPGRWSQHLFTYLVDEHAYRGPSFGGVLSRAKPRPEEMEKILTETAKALGKVMQILLGMDRNPPWTPRSHKQ